MVIDDLVGYQFTCKISDEFKNDSQYNEKEFNVVISKDDESESGYMAIVSGINDDDENYADEWDGEDVAKKILYETWIILKRQKV